MTEDGSETANVIQNNFIVRAWGTGHERADGRQGINDWGWEGSGHLAARTRQHRPEQRRRQRELVTRSPT